MQDYSRKDFEKILRCNGFVLSRTNGGHCIYSNSQGAHISLPTKVIGPMVKRLIKENNLIV